MNTMTILGMKMGGVNLLSLFKSWKTYYVATWKLIIFPCIIAMILILVKTIAGDTLINADMVIAVFIAFAMPTAGLSSTFSDSYNGDTEGAVAYTLGTTILSVITLPILYWLICMIV